MKNPRYKTIITIYVTLIITKSPRIKLNYRNIHQINPNHKKFPNLTFFIPGKEACLRAPGLPAGPSLD